MLFRIHGGEQGRVGLEEQFHGLDHGGGEVLRLIDHDGVPACAHGVAFAQGFEGQRLHVVVIGGVACFFHSVVEDAGEHVEYLHHFHTGLFAQRDSLVRKHAPDIIGEGIVETEEEYLLALALAPQLLGAAHKDERLAAARRATDQAPPAGKAEGFLFLLLVQRDELFLAALPVTGGQFHDGGLPQPALGGFYHIEAVLVGEAAGEMRVEEVLQGRAFVRAFFEGVEVVRKEGAMRIGKVGYVAVAAQAGFEVGAAYIGEGHAALQGKYEAPAARPLEHGFQAVEVHLRLTAGAGAALDLPAFAELHGLPVGGDDLVERPVLHFQHDEAVLRRVEHEVGGHAVQRGIEPAGEGHGQLLEKTVQPRFACGGIGGKGRGYHGGHAILLVPAGRIPASCLQAEGAASTGIRAPWRAGRGCSRPSGGRSRGQGRHRVWRRPSRRNCRIYGR